MNGIEKLPFKFPSKRVEVVLILRGKILLGLLDNEKDEKMNLWNLFLLFKSAKNIELLAFIIKLSKNKNYYRHRFLQQINSFIAV